MLRKSNVTPLSAAAIAQTHASIFVNIEGEKLPRFVMRKMFGTDGIRAVAGESPLDKRTVYAVGKALAHSLGKNPRVVMGMDTRESGPWIAATLVAGLRSGGADVESAGVITTPAIAFLARKHGFSA